MANSKLEDREVKKDKNKDLWPNLAGFLNFICQWSKAGQKWRSWPHLMQRKSLIPRSIFLLQLRQFLGWDLWFPSLLFIFVSVSGILILSLDKRLKIYVCEFVLFFSCLCYSHSNVKAEKHLLHYCLFKEKTSCLHITTASKYKSW